MDNKVNLKIVEMRNRLSDERWLRINKMIDEYVISIADKLLNKDIQAFVELTEKFLDKPEQYVWIKLLVFDPKKSGINHIGNGLAAGMFDMEVYDSSEIDKWLDHVSGIKANTISINDNNNGTNIKYELGNLIDQKDGNKKPKDENKQSEEFSLTDEEKLIEQKFIFSQLFKPDMGVTSNVVNGALFAVFHKYAFMFPNAIMQRLIVGDVENLALSTTFILQSLISELQHFDFTLLNIMELEFLGFVNWDNKCMLIPMWIFPIFLKKYDGLIVCDIQDSVYVIGKDYIHMNSEGGVMDIGIPLENGKKGLKPIFKKD